MIRYAIKSKKVPPTVGAVESNIEAGRQDINSDKSKLTYASITDAVSVGTIPSMS